MSDESVRKYVTSGRTRVNGWFHRVDAEIFATLMSTQSRLGIMGDALEIGVHHGRSFILVNLCMVEGEQSIAVDIFDQQELNIIDRSGKGNLNKFKLNLDRYGNTVNVKIISASSLDLNADELRKLSKNLRFISIDGGHWYGAVKNDLALAVACAGPDCIIAIDDFFNPDYPEVAAAYYDWRTPGSGFAPLCISKGKLYIYRGLASATYVTSMNENRFLRFNLKKTVPFVDGEVPVYTGRFGGLRGLAGKYTSYYTPNLHKYLKTRISGIR